MSTRLMTSPVPSLVRTRCTRVGWASRNGLTLLDLLVATCVALIVLGMVATALPPVLDVVQAVPEASDLHQRARAAERVLAAVVASAGAGADLAGEGPLPHAVPAVIPRRIGSAADPPATAWADRFTALAVPGGAAQAPLAQALVPGDTAVTLAWHPACGVHPTCGFGTDDLVLIYGRDGAMVLTTLAAANGLLLTLDEATDQSIALPAHATVVRTMAMFFDGGRRQLRRADDRAPSQPVTDEVVAMQVRYYGTAAPPGAPMVPGADTCDVAADGSPKLGLLGPVPGPPVELTAADFTDGPWCGVGVWRFDADLLRVRALRIALRLQAIASTVRGSSPLWFAMPGQARRPGQEVRDVEVDVFATAPNLAWGQ